MYLSAHNPKLTLATQCWTLKSTGSLIHSGVNSVSMPPWSSLYNIATIRQGTHQTAWTLHILQRYFLHWPVNSEYLYTPYPQYANNQTPIWRWLHIPCILSLDSGYVLNLFLVPTLSSSSHTRDQVPSSPRYLVNSISSACLVIAIGSESSGPSLPNMSSNSIQRAVCTARCLAL